MAQDRTITINEISRSIDKGLETADRHRAASLDRLQLVRKAKGGSLQREQARLIEKYGADHPRVQALAVRAVLNQGLISDLAVESVRARTEIPKVDENGWVLHGYVRDHDRNGVANLTVALYDQNGNWVRDLGHGCTDSNGYFKIESKSEIIHRGISVNVHVLKDQELVYTGKSVLTPAAGSVDYREIVVGEEPQVCMPPIVTSGPPPSGLTGETKGPD